MCVLKGSRSSVTASGENIRQRAAPAGAFFSTPMKSESYESLFFFFFFFTNLDRFSSGKC